jgi:hypothetical protein
MPYRKLTILALSVVVVVPGVFGQTIGENANEEPVALMSTAEALTRALQYAGFEDMKIFSRETASGSSFEVDIVDSTTPFLSDSISGSNRWLVQWDTVTLTFDTMWSEFNEANQVKKTFTFVLEAATGRLMKVYTEVADGDDITGPSFTVEEAEDRLRARGLVYAGFVDGVPPVSFYEALGEAIFIQPLRAKEIRAWLVMLSSRGREPFPCWVIEGRGVPRIPLPSAPVSGSQQPQQRLSGDCFRCVVDATTGKGLGCSNIPAKRQQSSR